jgi:uncharacterized protein (DUF1015 family)
MTDIRPFRALRYDPARVDLSRVIVPPYDVVAAEDRAAFFERDPHNAIRLELTRDVADEASTDYHHVREALDAWITERVLTRDPQPALYPLRQTFTAPDGARLSREGFALVHLGTTRAGSFGRTARSRGRRPTASSCCARARLSVVFLLYEDRERSRTALARSTRKRRAPGRARQNGRATVLVSPTQRDPHRGALLAIAGRDRRRPPPLRDRARLPRRAARRHAGRR